MPSKADFKKREDREWLVKINNALGHRTGDDLNVSGSIEYEKRRKAKGLKASDWSAVTNYRRGTRNIYPTIPEKGKY
jgi:hypothetical protein